MTSTKPTPSPSALADEDNPPIDIPTDAERDTILRNAFAEMRRNQDEQRAARDAAIPALDRLCKVLQGRSGQPYKVRALLYSLWNGQPASLVEVVCLDWAIRKDLCAVVLAFGFEDPGDESSSFFYDAIRDAVKRAGQWNWFLEAESEEGK